MIHFVRFKGNLKCAVSKEVTSNPTKAQGARMTMLNTAKPLLIVPSPKEASTPEDTAWGAHKTVTSSDPVSRTTDSAVNARCKNALALMNSSPTPASAATDRATSPR